MGVRTVPESEAGKAWRAKNPLRRWLDKGDSHAKLGQLIAGLGVARQTVYHWMEGYAIPRPERFQALSRMTGVTFDQWMKWYDVRPSA